MCTNQYQHLIQKQREFFNSGKTLSLEYRIHALKKLKAALKTYQTQSEQALSKDLGKSAFESYFGEIGGITVEIDHHIKNLKKWAKIKKVKTPLFLKPSRSRIMYDPYGVCLILSPWNYPFQLAIMPLIGAISAGNTAIVKPSEFAPHTASILKTIITSTFEEEYIALVEGGVPETTELLKQRFDFIFFTGSTKVGHIIAKAAAQHLTPVVLELGGKSPVILDESTPMHVALRRINMAKIINCGQTCVAPDYILLPPSRKEELILHFKKVLREFFPEGDFQEASTYQSMTRIINENNFQRLEDMLQGETILWGGKAFREERKFQPALVDCGNVRDYLKTEPTKRTKTKILEEEIFGPFFPLLTYDTIEDAIAYIKEGEKPLALYLYSDDKEIQHQVLTQISFGGGCINDSLTHLANEYLPFGGVGHSGQGAYHGKFSFLAFSHTKSILHSGTTFDLPLKYMPHTEKKLTLLKKFFK